MLIGLLAVLAACAFAQDPVIGDDKWAKLADQVRQRGKAVDPEIGEYVRRVGMRLAGGEPVKLETIDGEIGGGGMFAEWLPGYVFVPVRVLARTRSEAELAGVLAHAMSHHVQLTGGMPAAVGEGFNIAEEIRADREAVAKMTAAQYHPQALLDYVERVAYPMPARVTALKVEVAKATRRDDWIENTSDFAEMQARVRGIEPVLPRKAPSLRKK